MPDISDEFFMEEAVKEARLSEVSDDVPVGCVIVLDGEIIGRGHNTRELRSSALGHAEIEAISEACGRRNSWRLSGCTMYVTLEPCTMCAGAAVSARIDRVVIGAKDPKAGALGSVMDLNSYPLNHKIEIEYGVCREKCSSMLKAFFEKKRKKTNS
ncbi:MAG: nucleoside deaminase [Clostridia bacterium]|nr:nucleoside deaminase [Clostridia bacterium]